jgi:uncharacterized protein (TIRG00374 family)
VQGIFLAFFPSVFYSFQVMKSHHLILGLVIAGLALFLTFRNVSFHEIYQSIRGLEVQYLPLAVALFFASFAVRVYRWHYLCRAVKSIPPRRFYSPMMIGFMGNLLPLRAGEFIRAYLLGKREDIGFSTSFATIVVERIFDMASVLVLFAGLLVFNPQVFVPQDGAGDPRIVTAVQSFGVMSFAVCLGLIAFCYFLLHQQERTLRLVRFFTRILPQGLQQRIDEILRSFTEGLGVLRDPKGILAVVLLSALTWTVVVVANYPLYYAYGIESTVPPSSLVTLVVLLCAAVMIPTPGFIGPFQLAATFMLADLYGVDRAVAASFSLVIWFVQMSTICLAGLFFLLRDNISLVELSRAAREMGGQAQDRPG